MILKDALQLSFFFDQDDPDELAAYNSLQQELDVLLRTAKIGRFDGAGFDARSQSFRIELAGQDAETMLRAVRPLIAKAQFLIGPRATLISRSYQQGAGTSIRHVDL